MKNFKKENGITLVALIITIIVLLILAMVSIRLVMNGGIIDRAERGTKAYTEAEIGEQLKLVYAEYQMGQYQTPVDIEARLKEIFGNDNVQNVSVANGKLTATIKGKKYDYDIATGTVGEHVYVDPFNYGEGKTKATVAAGDEISITNGTTTEYFTVILNTSETILAMPKYNITLTEDHPVQSSSAGRTQFSATGYWTLGDDAIVMSDSRNNIQKYINAYKTTLEDMGAEGITVRAAKTSELEASGVTPAMRNPGQSDNFWLGSGFINGEDCVCLVNSGRNI